MKFDHLKGYRFHSVVESPDTVIFTLFQSRDSQFEEFITVTFKFWGW